MTHCDLVHAILVLMGFCVGLSVGSHYGLLGAILGAVGGFLIAHLVAVTLTIGEAVVHGIAWWWSEKRRT